MAKTEGMRADVIVVGAGLAGMTAALAAEQAGADVILVDRGPIGTGTNSALSNGAFSGPDPAEAAADYVKTVVQIGKRLNRLPYVEQIAREAPAAVEFLNSLGLEIAHTRGMWAVRSPRPEVIPGITLVRRVAERILERARIRVERGVRVTRLPQTSGRAAGVRGFDLFGRAREIRGSAVVLACGGAGAIYAKHDNQGTTLGQGYHLAAEAGLDLWDMEFVQFYPIVLDEPGLPSVMIYPPYPPEAKLLGPAGDDLLAKHDLGDINQAIVRKRDAFSAMIVAESSAGPVRMDLRAVPQSRWAVHPLSLLARCKFDFRTTPVRITPGTHFFMGGVRTDADGQTALPGLFACGEIVWGLHGANRMGGNALMECLVSGRVAGRGAAVSAHALPTRAADAIPPEPHRTGEGARPADLRGLRQRIRDAAWRYAGVVRSGEGIVAGLAEAERIRAAIGTAGADTSQERALRDDLRSAVFVLEAVLTASLARCESRGTFIRTDWPAQDDSNWLKNSRLIWNPTRQRFNLEHIPVSAE
jgi:succinate dehydrogenase / fumarate reductase, flavoprotein subunit